MVGHPPRAFPWEQYLPWAPVRVRQSTALRPEGADRARGFVSARGVDASISPAAGTSATARTRNVSGRSTAGRQRAGKPDIASTPRPEPSMPRRKKRAVSERSLRPRPLRARSYAGAWSRSRRFFSPPLCDRPGCHEHPVSSPRNPARYCGPACRQAVRNVQDRERKWLSRGTSDGRKKRAIEYQAARRRRIVRSGHLTNSAPSRPPPQ